jgi:hypothetical protein
MCAWMVCGDDFIDRARRRVDMSWVGRVCLLVVLVLIAISPLFAVTGVGR